MPRNPSQQSCCLLTACWPSPQPANLTLIRSKNAWQVACLARLVICSYWFKEEEAIVSVSDSGAACFFAPTPHVERKHSCERSRLLSLLLQYTPCNLIRALCREQSDSALLFQGLLFHQLRPMQPNWRTCCLPLRPTGMQLAGVSCSLARSCSNGGTISQARVRLSLNLHCSCRPAVLPFSNECGRLNGSVSCVSPETE